MCIRDNLTETGTQAVRTKPADQRVRHTGTSAGWHLSGARPQWCQTSVSRDVGTDPLDDLRGGRAWCEDLRDTELVELRNIGLRDDAAAEHDDVLGVALCEQRRDLGEQGHVGLSLIHIS